MSQTEGPLPPKMENGLLIAAAVALGLVLVCGLCAAGFGAVYLLGIRLWPF